MKKIATVLKTIGQKSASQTTALKCYPYLFYQPSMPKKLQEQMTNNK